ncbi:MFS transporter [Cellulomonas marina]|uniref:Fucose permease n=1 Tax=Cellulomonas marina TaxID=988821 RepID=A0A1I1ARP9_9CELL|nr:MFS transporter [Cellulomonas marina]GIG30457.1 MFS transporter [Cellulomonas marina]SFB39003.1 Fucose permease [Cellulomonas marina]
MTTAAGTAPASVPAVARRARAAVSGLFLVNAVLYANLVPRLPEVKDRLDLSNAAFGTGIAAMPVGALLAGLLAPMAIRRFGSGVVASVGLVLLSVAVLAVPFTGSWWAFVGALAVAGALDSLVDVGQNAHGFRVQRLYRRSIVNAFHGLWSIGAVLGGLMGSLAAGADVPLGLHLAVVAAVFSTMALVGMRFLLRGPEDAEREVATEAAAGSLAAAPTGPPDEAGGAATTGTNGTSCASNAVRDPSPRGRRGFGGASRATLRLLLVLGLLAVAGAYVEDAGASWGALWLRTEVGAAAAVGGLAFVALQVAMTVGRLTGDRVTDRLGQARVARIGGVLVTVGLGAMLAFPSVATTLVGFALAGLGVATLIPAAMHAADELPGLPHGVGLTVVSWLLRVGFLVSPPLVGVIADAAGLRVGLLVVVVSGVLVVLLAPALRAHGTPGAAAAAAPATTSGSSRG